MYDTPENLRRAAFDGEVVDVRTRRPPSDEDVAALRAMPFVAGGVEQIEATMLRVVVPEAEAAPAQITEFLASIDVQVVEATEHVVDYDEAFVRVVERHRSGNEGVDADTADERRQDESPGPARPGESHTERVPS
jgi:hypothetical protein